MYSNFSHDDQTSERVCKRRRVSTDLLSLHCITQFRSVNFLKRKKERLANRNNTGAPIFPILVIQPPLFQALARTYDDNTLSDPAARSSAYDTRPSYDSYHPRSHYRGEPRRREWNLWNLIFSSEDSHEYYYRLRRDVDGLQKVKA